VFQKNTCNFLFDVFQKTVTCNFLRSKSSMSYFIFCILKNICSFFIFCVINNLHVTFLDLRDKNTKKKHVTGQCDNLVT